MRGSIPSRQNTSNNDRVANAEESKLDNTYVMSSKSEIKWWHIIMVKHCCWRKKCGD